MRWIMLRGWIRGRTLLILFREKFYRYTIWLLSLSLSLSLSLTLYICIPMKCYWRKPSKVNSLTNGFQFLHFKLLKGKNEDMKLLYGKGLKSENLGDLHAECLTDAWIGKDRFNISLTLTLTCTQIDNWNTDA